jgi:hypothetical protein
MTVAPTLEIPTSCQFPVQGNWQTNTELFVLYPQTYPAGEDTALTSEPGTFNQVEEDET